MFCFSHRRIKSHTKNSDDKNFDCYVKRGIYQIFKNCQHVSLFLGKLRTTARCICDNLQQHEDNNLYGIEPCIGKLQYKKNPRRPCEMLHIITLLCRILAHTSFFNPAYIRFWPTVRHFWAHCVSLFGPLAAPHRLTFHQQFRMFRPEFGRVVL